MPYKIIHKYNNLLTVKVLNRPSKKIKSPYLADICIDSKNELAHSPGLGLCGFISTDSIVAVSSSDSEKRKSKYTIELVQVENDNKKKIWVGANPVTSNMFFRKMIEMNLLNFLPKIDNIKQEVTFKGFESRFDFMLETSNKRYIVEIKNVPIIDYPEDKMPSFRKFPVRKDGIRTAVFPDGYQGKKGLCVSPRALKHLQELVKIKKTLNKGPIEHIPMLVFVVQREDCGAFSPNFDKDPVYSKALKDAYDNGLLVKVVMLKLSTKNVKFIKELPIKF